MKSVIALLLFTVISLPAFAQQDFRIVITNYYFGRSQYITTVTPDSMITNHTDYGKSKVIARRLTQDEKKELDTFLKDFPLTGLKDKYINEHVDDGTQIGFFISIGKEQKSIFISNVYQKELGRLTDEIVKLLPYDYILYNKTTVPYEE